jgi:hypothetical protein
MGVERTMKLHIKRGEETRVKVDLAAPRSASLR